MSTTSHCGSASFTSFFVASSGNAATSRERAPDAARAIPSPSAADRDPRARPAGACRRASPRRSSPPSSCRCRPSDWRRESSACRAPLPCRSAGVMVPRGGPRGDLGRWGAVAEGTVEWRPMDDTAAIDAPPASPLPGARPAQGRIRGEQAAEAPAPPGRRGDRRLRADRARRPRDGLPVRRQGQLRAARHPALAQGPRAVRRSR